MTSADSAFNQAQQEIRAGNQARAMEILIKANADPASRSLPNLVLQAEVLYAQQNIPAAIAVLESAESFAGNATDKARVLTMLADLLCGRPDAGVDEINQGIGYLEKALSLSAGPASAKTRKNLCALYFRLENFAAVHRHALILADFPQFRAKANLWLANSVLHLELAEGTGQYLSAAAAGSTDLDDADLAWLIETALNCKAYELAQRIIDEAVAVGRSSMVIDAYQARLYYENKDYNSALNILTDEFVRTYAKNAEATQFVLFTRGRSLNATGEYVAAHECYELMNQVAERAYPDFAGPDYVGVYRSLDLTALPVYPLPESIPCKPVFMVGFPRSGTTLLDSILDTQEQITTVSEKMGIPSAWHLLEKSGRQYPRELPDLDATDVQLLREMYFEQMLPYIGSPGAAAVVIDKLPLNIIHLPFIDMLFPGARFIVSLRHPLDVCLSCFQQGFQMNDEMRHFTRLESTFARYRNVMSLYLQYQQAGRFNILPVRYEDLVEQFESTALKVFEYLQVEPNDDFREFHAINRRKFSATPSRDQVTEPLYQSSRERWRNYSACIEPHIETVKPLIDAFGYQV